MTSKLQPSWIQIWPQVPAQAVLPRVQLMRSMAEMLWLALTYNRQDSSEVDSGLMSHH